MVVDLGCGEGKLGKEVGGGKKGGDPEAEGKGKGKKKSFHDVYSFDLVSANEWIEVADISNVPVEVHLVAFLHFFL